MDHTIVIPRGIWYEKERDRWRVKLIHEGALLHRSYHKVYDDALKAWKQAKKSIVRPKPQLPIPESSIINQFLCRPLPGSSRVQGH